MIDFTYLCFPIQNMENTQEIHRDDYDVLR